MVYFDPTAIFDDTKETFQELLMNARKNYWSATYCAKVTNFIQNKNNKQFINVCHRYCLCDLVSSMAPPEFFECLLDKVEEPLDPVALRCDLFLIIEKFGDVRDSANRKKYLELFLQKGADLSFHPIGEDSALDCVLKTGDLECIKFLLKKRYLTLDYQDKHNNSFVDYLVRTGNLECIKFLLKKRCLILVDKDGDSKYFVDQKSKSLVDYLVRTGNLECIKFLLVNKCLSLDYINRYGPPLVQSLLETGDLECIKLLLKEKRIKLDYKDKQDKQTILHHAVSASKADTVQYLITEAPSLLNSQDSCGETALHYATWDKKTEMIKLLCEAKADPNIPEYRGKTPLYSLLSECSNYDDIALFEQRKQQKLQNIELMLKHGAKLDIVDNDGNTPLHHAVSEYQPNQKTRDLLSILGILSIPEFLLQKVANIKGYIDRQNKDGDTALHIALRGGQGCLAEVLCDYQASCDISNNKGELPLDVAINVYQSKEINYLPIMQRIVSSMDLSQESIVESLEKIESPALRTFLNESISPIQKKNARNPIKQQVEEVVDEEVLDEEVLDEEVLDEEVLDEEVVDEEVVDEEVVEEVVDESVPIEGSLNPWQQLKQKLVWSGWAWGRYPFLKQDRKYAELDWITQDDFSINHNSLLGNSHAMGNILVQENGLPNLYIHEVCDNLDYYTAKDLGVLSTTLPGSVLLKE